MESEKFSKALDKSGAFLFLQKLFSKIFAFLDFGCTFVQPNDTDMKSKITITAELKAGNNLIIGYFKFPVENDCTLEVSGTIVHPAVRPGDGPALGTDFSVKCDAIKLDVLKAKGHESIIAREKEMVWCSAMTDIGGHEVLVEWEEGTWNVCLLKNGFGDGKYTMRFSEGSHER